MPIAWPYSWPVARAVWKTRAMISVSNAANCKRSTSRSKLSALSPTRDGEGGGGGAGRGTLLKDAALGACASSGRRAASHCEPRQMEKVSKLEGVPQTATGPRLQGRGTWESKLHGGRGRPGSCPGPRLVRARPHFLGPSSAQPPGRLILKLLTWKRGAFVRPDSLTVGLPKGLWSHRSGQSSRIHGGKETQKSLGLRAF